MNRPAAVPRLRLNLRLLCLLGLLAPAALTPPGAAVQPLAKKPLTAEQRAKLKERDRYAQETQRLRAAGKLAEAITACEKMLALWREVSGIDENFAGWLAYLAEMYQQREDFPAAQKARQEVLAIREKLHGAADWRVTDARLELEDLERWARLSAAQRDAL
jgi:hypothetical protein